jgi:hypothetical protein
MAGLHVQDVDNGSGDTMGQSTVNSLELAWPLTDSRRIPRFGDSSNNKNSIYHTNSSWWQITGYRSVNSMAMGDPVCKEGYAPADPDGSGPLGAFAYTGQMCGQLLTNDWTFDVDLNNNLLCLDPWSPGDHCNVGRAARADFDLANSGAGHYGIAGGDSGSAVYWGLNIWGLVSLNDGSFSLAGKIRDDIDIDWCANNDCSAVGASH